MPELPEVESIKLQLQKYLVGSHRGEAGHKIESVEVGNSKIFQGKPSDVSGAKVTSIRRFAKVLSIDLSNGNSLVIHIKLTGQIIYRGPNLPTTTYNLSPKVVGGIPGPHTHVIFKLDKGGFLYYNDVRRFGWIRVIKTSDVEKTGFVGKLGPEPFGKLNLKYFQEVLAKTKRAIKVVLMDQAKIGGVGNIYANDALWDAKINPKRSADNLSGSEVKDLYNSVHKVLKAGLKYGGASEQSFVTPDGTDGEYQKHTLVYGREDDPCKRCRKARIIKYFLSGRGTYVCPVCQK